MTAAGIFIWCMACSVMAGKIPRLLSTKCAEICDGCYSAIWGTDSADGHYADLCSHQSSCPTCACSSLQACDSYLQPVALQMVLQLRWAGNQGSSICRRMQKQTIGFSHTQAQAKPLQHKSDHVKVMTDTGGAGCV